MTTIFPKQHPASLAATAARAAFALAAASLLAACVGYADPQPVEQTAPTVTYNYRSDQELIAATNRGEAFCANYSSAANIANITDNPDGSYDVVFRCDSPYATATTRAVPAPPPRPPSVSYSYRSHHELVQATRTAESYCQSYNARPRMARITAGAPGVKTVVFDCVGPA